MEKVKNNDKQSKDAVQNIKRIVLPATPFKKALLLIVFGLSGAAALIYEVVWSRSLQFIFGSTVETISTIFSAFLLGFALGSFIFRNLADKTEKPLFYLALFEISIGAYGFLMPVITGYAKIFYHSIISDYLILKTLLCLLILIVPTTLSGAIWPFISRYYLQRSKQIGSSTGGIYSINSLGSALGALASGFLLIPFLGIRAASMIAASINLLAGLLILFVKEAKNEK